MSATIRQAWVAVRFLLVMTVVLGVVYPVGVYAVGRVVPARADGSFVTTQDGTVVGSALIGQRFDGVQYFHSRPSAAGTDGYDALSSSGTNLGPNNEDLVSAVPYLCRTGLGLPVMSWTIRNQAEADLAKPHIDQIVFEGFRPN